MPNFNLNLYIEKGPLSELNSLRVVLLDNLHSHMVCLVPEKLCVKFCMQCMQSMYMCIHNLQDSVS